MLNEKFEKNIGEIRSKLKRWVKKKGMLEIKEDEMILVPVKYSLNKKIN